MEEHLPEKAGTAVLGDRQTTLLVYPAITVLAPCGFPLPCQITLELLEGKRERHCDSYYGNGTREAETARPLKQLPHEGISNVAAVSNLISIDLFPVQSTLKKELNLLPSQSSDSHVQHPRDTKGAGQHTL